MDDLQIVHDLHCLQNFPKKEDDLKLCQSFALLFHILSEIKQRSKCAFLQQDEAKLGLVAFPMGEVSREAIAVLSIQNSQNFHFVLELHRAMPTTDKNFYLSLGSIILRTASSPKYYWVKPLNLRTQKQKECPPFAIWLPCQQQAISHDIPWAETTYLIISRSFQLILFVSIIINNHIILASAIQINFSSQLYKKDKINSPNQYPLLQFTMFILQQIYYPQERVDMPSTLYESVKKSVIEFSQLRKKNQKLEDKLVFRWKLITLGLSIVFIILVGGFSQILKAVNNLPDLHNQKTYILPVLQKVSPVSVPTIQQANYLVNGISSGYDNSGSEYAWNKAQLIFDFQNNPSPLVIGDIVNAISSKGHLVWIVSSPGPNSPNKFAFFTNQAYSESSGKADVFDSSDSRFSTFFNLDAQVVLNYDVANCPIYSRTANQFTLFSSFTIFPDGTAQVSVENNKFDCFKSVDINTANALLTKLTGLIVNPTAPITIDNIQVFQLSLDQSL